MKRAIKPIHPFCQHSALMSSSFWRYHHLLFLFLFFFYFCPTKGNLQGHRISKTEHGFRSVP